MQHLATSLFHSWNFSMTRTYWEFPWLGSSPKSFQSVHVGSQRVLLERSARNCKMWGNPLDLWQEWRLQREIDVIQSELYHCAKSCKIPIITATRSGKADIQQHMLTHTASLKERVFKALKTPMCWRLRAMTCHDSPCITFFAEIRSWSLWSCLTLLDLRGSLRQSLHRITPRLRDTDPGRAVPYNMAMGNPLQDEGFNGQSLIKMTSIALLDCWMVAWWCLM